MALPISYILYDLKTGEVLSIGEVPSDLPELFPPEIPEGQGLIEVLDGRLPREPSKIDRRKVRKSPMTVETLDGIVTSALKPIPVDVLLFVEQSKALQKVDEIFAKRIAAVTGPMAALHAEKRRQAENKTGALVSNEKDRLAILANAEKEDKIVAAIDQERRDIKAAIKVATEVGEIEAIMKPFEGQF